MDGKFIRDMEPNCEDFDRLYGDMFYKAGIESEEVVDNEEDIVHQVEVGVRIWMNKLRQRAKTATLLKKELEELDIEAISHWIEKLADQPEQTGTKQEMIADAITYLDHRLEGAKAHYRMGQPLEHVHNYSYETFTMMVRHLHHMKNARTHTDAMFAFACLRELLKAHVKWVNAGFDEEEKQDEKKKKKSKKRKTKAMVFEVDSDDDDF